MFDGAKVRGTFNPMSNPDPSTDVANWLEVASVSGSISI